MGVEHEGILETASSVGSGRLPVGTGVKQIAVKMDGLQAGTTHVQIPSSRRALPPRIFVMFAGPSPKLSSAPRIMAGLGHGWPLAKNNRSGPRNSQANVEVLCAFIPAASLLILRATSVASPMRNADGIPPQKAFPSGIGFGDVAAKI
jgi:hypothetical protein